MDNNQPKDFAMPDVSDYSRPSLLDHRGWASIRQRLEDIKARADYLQQRGHPDTPPGHEGRDVTGTAREIEILARECIAAGDARNGALPAAWMHV